VIAVDARYLRRANVGISVYLRDLIAELLAGYRLVLLTSSDAHARRLRIEYPACDTVVLPERRELVWEQRLLPRFLARARPDAYIAGANRGLPARSPRGTRLILVVHDLIPLRWPVRHLLRDPFRGARYVHGTALSLARADLVIANSRSTATDVATLRRRRTVTVRYPTIPSLRAAGTLPAGWPEGFLLHCGGADPRKNVERLLAAHAGYLADGGTLPLVVLGTGFDALRAKLRGGPALAGAVFAGQVSEELKWRALAHATAVLYPSSWEGFGLPILEAFSAGTAVMAGLGGAQREVGGDAALYVDGRDRGAIGDGIWRVLDPGWQAAAPARGYAQLELLRHARRDALEIVGGLL
jgi:glycosyltransferase involved in cell wall biosynthesis